MADSKYERYLSASPSTLVRRVQKLAKDVQRIGAAAQNAVALARKAIPIIQVYQGDVDNEDWSDPTDWDYRITKWVDIPAGATSALIWLWVGVGCTYSDDATGDISVQPVIWSGDGDFSGSAFASPSATICTAQAATAAFIPAGQLVAPLSLSTYGTRNAGAIDGHENSHLSGMVIFYR